MRAFLAIIFLLIFSFQVLPVRGMSKLFGKSQVSAEMQDDDIDTDHGPGKVVKYGDDIIVPYIVADNPQVHNYFEKKVSLLIPKGAALPTYFVADIPCPPPNF